MAARSNRKGKTVQINPELRKRSKNPERKVGAKRIIHAIQRIQRVFQILGLGGGHEQFKWSGAVSRDGS